MSASSFDGVNASNATSEEPCVSRTSPVTTSSTHHVTSRKPSSHSLAIFNRPVPVTPPVVHWGASPESPDSDTSSSTLIESSQEESADADATVRKNLRSHLTTCLDENKLANRSATLDDTLSYCATRKGFRITSGSQLDGSFHHLLTHSAMLDIALRDSDYGMLAFALGQLDQGTQEFLETLDRLPFELRNTQSLISGTSDILEAKSVITGLASELGPQPDGRRPERIMERSQHGGDMLMRAIRVFLDIVAFESRLLAKLPIKETSVPTPTPKKRIRFRRPTLSLRKSNVTLRSKPQDAPPASSPSQPEPEDRDEEEDDYSYYAAMADVSLEEAEEYWGVRMPGPVGDAVDYFTSRDSDSIEGASLAALVYILTDPQPRTPASDPDLLGTFMLCFRSFCDPIDVAKELVLRYEEQPGDLNRSQLEAWPAYRSAVKARVLRFISIWVDQFWIHERDRIAGLHIKEFVTQMDDTFFPDEREEIIRKLDDRRAEAIALTPSGDSEEGFQHDEASGIASRAACRQKPTQYKGRFQAEVEKLIRNVSYPAPTDDELQRAKALDDLVRNNDNAIHILDMNSSELCEELARQLAIFMSDGYLKIIPEDLWYRLSMGRLSEARARDVDAARSTQKAYESAVASWVTGSILAQVESATRGAVMTFFIALAVRSHEYNNFSAVRSIHAGLTHPSLGTLSDLRLPMKTPTCWALARLCGLKENMDAIAFSGDGIHLFPQPAVPAMDWYFTRFGIAINAKSHVECPNSQRLVPNVERCYAVVQIIHEMEQCHVPYKLPRSDNVQAWLLKTLEGVISRDFNKESDWMFKESLTIEQTGRPEPIKQKLPRLSNPFVKKNKPEWKVATIRDLVPDLELEPDDWVEPDSYSFSDFVAMSRLSRFSKPLPPLPLA